MRANASEILTMLSSCLGVAVITCNGSVRQSLEEVVVVIIRHLHSDWV